MNNLLGMLTPEEAEQLAAMGINPADFVNSGAFGNAGLMGGGMDGGHGGGYGQHGQHGQHGGGGHERIGAAAAAAAAATARRRVLGGDYAEMMAGSEVGLYKLNSVYP
jgi:hypothetical protein